MTLRGAMAMRARFDDLDHRAAAYADADPETGLPTRWTPELVEERLVAAFDVMARTPGRIGPRPPGSAWPEYWRERPALVELEAWRKIAAEASAAVMRRATIPSSAEAQRAAEALAWCLRYLGDKPTLSDALQLRAFCLASGRDLDKALLARRKKADALVDRREPGVDRRPKVDLAVAREAAALIAITANAMIERAEQRLRRAKDAKAIGKAHKLKRDATAYAAKRLRKELRRKGAIQAPPAPKTKRSDVMPGMCFSRSYLDQKRKEAAALIAAALNREGKPVR